MLALTLFGLSYLPLALHTPAVWVPALSVSNHSQTALLEITRRAHFKAILRDAMVEEKFHFFFIIHLCNDPCCLRILSPQCIRAGYLA